MRPARFDGSHLGEADFILLMIALVVLTLLGWHAARIAAGLNEWPAHASFLSNWLAGHVGSSPRGTRARARLGARARDPHVPRLPAVLEAPAHRDRRSERLLRPDAPTWPARAAALRRARRRDALRRRDGRRPDVEGDGRLVLVHGVRALPGRLPCIRDGQAPVAEAADHGHSRSAAGRRPEPARRRRADADRRERRPGGDGVGLRHLRRVRPRVPGVDRARRPHRRPAPQPRDDGVELPAGGRVDAARRRAGRQSVGQAAGRPCGVGRGPRSACRRGRRGCAGDPLLGGLRRGLRRARAQGGRVDREAVAEGGGRLRDPRRARVVHRRSGPPDGERVRVPVVRRAERRDTERGRGHEDRRELSRTVSTRSATSTPTSAGSTR